MGLNSISRDVEFDPAKVEKILVVRNDNLGDVICTIPAIEALRRAFPDAFLAALVADYTADALDGCPFLDALYSYEKAKHSKRSRLAAWRAQWKVLSAVRREGFDLAIGIRSRFTTSHAWLVYISGARLRLGHRPPRGAGRLSRGYYNIFAPDETEELHEVERSLNVVRRIGVDIERKSVAMHIPAEALAVADDFLKKKGFGHTRPVICIHITSRPEHDRFWPVESYVELIDSLMGSAKADVVLNWMPAEEPTVREIMGRVKEKPTVFKATGLKGFAGLLHRLDLLITLEGGAMHIGAASGVKTIAIFGKTSTTVWAPWGEGNITLKRGPKASMVPASEVIEAALKAIA